MCKIQDVMARLEGIIILAEMFEEHKVDAPCAATTMLDLIGPLMMQEIKKAKGWDNVECARQMIQFRKKLFAAQGIDNPASPLEDLIVMLADTLAAKNGAKPADDDDGAQVHVIVVRDDEKKDGGA